MTNSSVPNPSQIAVEGQIQRLSSLITLLPSSVPLATKNDEVFRVFTKIPIPDDPKDQWPIFNCQMDILFGKDVRNTDGRLANVVRGPLGMDLVMDYLSKAVTAKYLLWEPVQPKLKHLINELQWIM
jgi:hypothetical protein